MKESPKVNFPIFSCQSKQSQKQCEQLNSELDEIYKQRANYLATSNATPTADGKSSFEQSYVARDAKGFWIDTHQTEKELLESTGEFVESLITEAVKNVQDCEANSETAFTRIKAEIDAYGLIWLNDNQFNLFVRRSQALAPFETLVSEAKNCETAARHLVREMKDRIQWLHHLVIEQRTSMALVG